MRHKPATLLLAILLFLPLPGIIPPTSAATPEQAATAGGVEQGIFSRINRVRQNKGLPPLEQDDRLQDLARAQSRDMAENHYLGHVDSRKRGLKERVKDARLSGWKVIGENVARTYGYRQVDGTMVREWLESRPHRANILNGRFRFTGVGVVRRADGSYYASQIFMGPGK